MVQLNNRNRRMVEEWGGGLIAIELLYCRCQVTVTEKERSEDKRSTCEGEFKGEAGSLRAAPRGVNWICHDW